MSCGVGFGDIDNDGDMDVVAENLDGSPTVLRNDGGNRNNRINIRPMGFRLNTQGLGVRVNAVAGDVLQVDEVRSGVRGSPFSARTQQIPIQPHPFSLGSARGATV